MQSHNLSAVFGVLACASIIAFARDSKPGELFNVPGALYDPIAFAEMQKIPLRIMPLGDSITFGSADPSSSGYRRLLGKLLTDDGYSIDFVGSRQSGHGAIDPDNEGHPGWTIEQLKDGIDSHGWLETYRPDLILLHIGTNDLRQGKAASAPAHLEALLDDILKRLPQTRLVVAQIIPFRQGSDLSQRSYNDAIARIVLSKGPRVSVVNMQNILSASDYADEVHPNAGGYDKMARAWKTAIRATVSGSTRGAAPRSLDVDPAAAWNLHGPYGHQLHCGKLYDRAAEGPGDSVTRIFVAATPVWSQLREVGRIGPTLTGEFVQT